MFKNILKYIEGYPTNIAHISTDYTKINFKNDTIL